MWIQYINKISMITQYIQCLLGLENGNGVCIRLDTEKPEFTIQEWRDKNYSFIHSTAIVHIGTMKYKYIFR